MFEYRYKNLFIKAIGIGGIETVYILPELSISFDVGRCPDPLVDTSRIFLTHGHLDHSAGLPYYFSQRALKRLPPGEAFVHERLVEPLTRIIQTWHEIEGFQYEIKINAIKPGEYINIKNEYFVTPLKSYHRVPCQGYALLRRSKKLLPQYLNLKGEKIKELKESGLNIFEERDIPLFAFSGDSTIEFIQENQLARRAQVLFIECTYIDEKRPVAKAREWGHIHLDEIIKNADLFENERIVLTHFSKRYSPNMIRNTLKTKLPKSLQSRVDVLF